MKNAQYKGTLFGDCVLKATGTVNGKPVEGYMTFDGTLSDNVADAIRLNACDGAIQSTKALIEQWVRRGHGGNPHDKEFMDGQFVVNVSKENDTWQAKVTGNGNTLSIAWEPEAKYAGPAI